MDAQKKAQKITEEVNTETKKRTTILTDLERAERSLAKAMADDAIAVQNLRVQTQELNKKNKEQAKDVLGLISPYQKFAKQVNDAKKDAKNLGAEMILLEQKFKKGEITQRQYNTQLNKLSKEYVEATVKGKGLDSQVKKIDSSVGDSQRNVGNYKSALGGLTTSFRSLLGSLGVVGGIAAFGSLIKSSYETVKALDAQNAALKQIFQTEEQVAFQKEFLADVSNRYGLELISTTNAYTKYAAAMRDTNLEGEKGRMIFESFSGASARLGLNAEQQNGIFKALEQMISKGTVQAEELRGQLGDRLPGAFKLFADAAGVSTKELGEMLKKGEVLTVDILPKVAETLNATYGLGLDTTVDTLAAAQNRLKNSWTEFLNETANNKEIMNFISDFLQDFGELLSWALDVLILKGDDGRSVLADLLEILYSLSGTIFDLGEKFGIFEKEIENSSKRALSFMDNMEQLKTTLNLVLDTVKYLIEFTSALFSLGDGWTAFADKADKAANKYASSIDIYNKKTAEITSRQDMSESAIWKRNEIAKTKEYSAAWNKAKESKKAYFQYEGKYYSGTTGRNTNKSLDDYIDVGSELVAKKKAVPYTSSSDGKTKKTKAKRDTSASDAKKAQADFEKEQRDLYNAEKENIDKTNQLRAGAIKNNLDLAKDDPYSTESKKITDQINFYSELIKANNDYYNELIENAKKYNQDKFIVDFERQRDIESGKIDTSRISLALKVPEAAKKDLEYLQNIDDLGNKAGFEEAKRIILADKKLSVKDKEYQLSILELKNELEVLNIEKERVATRQKELGLKARSGQLTQDEKTEWAAIAEQAGIIENSILETSKTLEKIQFDKVAEAFSPLVDYISGGLNDLGLNSIADQFSSMYQRILKEGKDFTLTTADFMNAGAALISDFGSQLIEAETSKRIAALDAQLEATASATEQELEFIDGRLQRLNAMDELSKEQIEQRNALEDEARTLREQQLEREKQIEAQKARAMQRAQAQQVLMAGFQAGVMAFASQLIPGDPTSLFRASIAAAAAVGFAGANAALIMSKDPVPNYFVGRKNGPAEIAYTQEKGREIITDKSGKVKSLGSDSGAVLTNLGEGDKVFTAAESLKLFSQFPEINVGQNIHRIDNSRLYPIILQNNIDYDILAKKVGDQFGRQFKRFSTTQITVDPDGNMFQEKPGQIPIFIGKKRVPKQNLEIKINRNVRD